MRSTRHHTTGRTIPALLSLAIVALVTTFGIGAGPAGATSCARPGPDQLLDLATVIVGTVSDRISTGVDEDSFGAPAEVFAYPLADVEVLYGVVETDEVTVLLAEQNGINLGGDLVVGDRYGFTFYEVNGSELPINVCSFDSAEAIHELTGVAAGEGSELPAPTTTTTTSAVPNTTPTTTTTTTVPSAEPSSDGSANWVGPAIGIAGMTVLGVVGVTLARRHKGS